MTKDIAAIHQFWFGPLDTAGFPAPGQEGLWFTSNEQSDAGIRTRFGTLVGGALNSEFEQWPADNNGLVALVLLLDQFTRNIFRGTPRAFAGDEQALQLATAAIAAGRLRTLPAIHRVFLYMPLEHCEDLAVQEECVRHFADLADETGADSVNAFSRYAVAHRDVIARFGRFPHRNTILGRDSTAQELAWLAQHGGF